MEDFVQNISYTKARSLDECYDIVTSIIKYDCQIISQNKNKNSAIVSIKYNHKIYSLSILLNRIFDNGFPHNRRPEIKRIQIRPIEEDTSTNSDRCFLLTGAVYYSKEPILVVWNPFGLNSHKTNRSVYVNASSLKSAYEDGFYSGTNCETNLYACKKGFFCNLLKKYISDTKFEELKW